MEEKNKILTTTLVVLLISVLLLIAFSIVFWFKLDEETEKPMPFVGQEERPLYVSDEVIVKFKDEILEEQINNFYKEYNFEETYRSIYADFRVLRFSKDKRVIQIIEGFENNPLIEYVEPNYYVYPAMVPNDPMYGGQWNLKQINMEKAWDVAGGGSSDVVVAVIDSGVTYKDFSRWNIKKEGGNSFWQFKDIDTGTIFNDNFINYCFNLPGIGGLDGDLAISYKYKYDLRGAQDIQVALVIKEAMEGGRYFTISTKEYEGGSDGWEEESVVIERDSITMNHGMSIYLRGYPSSLGSDSFFNLDDFKIKDSSGKIIFEDNMEDTGRSVGKWIVGSYKKPSDFPEENVWLNSGEIPDDNIDNDSNGFIDDINGWDFTRHDSFPFDSYQSHGTEVASVIVSSTNNGKLMAGIAYNVKVIPIRVIRDFGESQYLADGIYYAVENGAKIINISLGLKPSDLNDGEVETIREALKKAYKSDVVLVAACANTNKSSCEMPAAFDDYVIAVGASDENSQKTSYSNYGPTLDMLAPGGERDTISAPFFEEVRDMGICEISTWEYKPSFGGTSAAAPHVSGVAALLLSKNPSLTSLQVKYVLELTAKDLGEPGWDKETGCGIMDAYKAITEGLSNLDKMPDDFDMTKHGCKRESKCGDRVINEGEECDNGDNNSDSEPNACRTDCTSPKCGDGVIDTNYCEECDDGDDNSNTEDSCRTTCRKPRCGDLITDTGEECDGGYECSLDCKEPSDPKKQACVSNYFPGFTSPDSGVHSIKKCVNWPHTVSCYVAGGDELYEGKTCAEVGYGCCCYKDCSVWHNEYGLMCSTCIQTSEEDCDYLRKLYDDSEGRPEYFPDSSCSNL